MTKHTIRRLGGGAVALVAATALAACSAPAAGTSDAAAGEDKGTITMGFLPAWTDGLSTAHLLKVNLEAAGYTVETEELSEAGPLYAALAQGDIDIYPSAWSEVTHAAYMEKYGADLEDLGSYYGNAKLTWAVPSYSEIQSIADLPDYADVLDNKIIGIEPGAGLTKASLEQVIPTYGLEDFELVTSSTTAMLAELKSKTDAQEEIVVTLWRPFWANSTFDMRDLEDPEGALGGSEGLHFLARSGFAEDFPEVADWIGQIKLDDTQYGSLEDTVVNQYDEGQGDDAVKAWMEANPDVLPALA